MTDPLTSNDVALLKRYDAELEEIDALPPAAIELTAMQALALVTHIQFSVADPAVKYEPLMQSAIAAAKQIQQSFNPQSAIYQILELGWQRQPEKTYDSHKIFTGQKKKPLRTPY